MIYLIAFLLLITSGCSIISPHKDSKYGTSSQGIPLDNIEISKVKTGMSKNQVANLIGTPPHINSFAPDTWVYFHMQHGKVSDKKLKLSFKNNKLVNIEHINTKHTA
ncbi:MAG: outer membrane protein assembly factor BamE [Pseudomonadota bacterium]|nr:outer membrane protein assembly factor BamE [Pseudomonadota bacterium]